MYTPFSHTPTLPALQLGYLVFGAARPSKWQDFCSRMLGLPAPIVNADGSNGWRVDGASQRLIVQADASDDLMALGLDCGSAAGLQARAEQLARSGCEIAAGSEAQCQARRVEALYALTDPAGNRVELFHGLQQAPAPFESAAFPGGFRTGDLGLGHAVLAHRDLEAMEAFYVGQLGFRVTERLDTRKGPVHVRGTFLHCNRRHHSLALFDIPSRKRMHHFMLQANDYADVGRALERSNEIRVPLSLELGQHPAPDSTFSFYGATPSGFDFEIGAGSNEIDPQHWDAMNTSVTSSWGHQPRMRLKLRMASALALQKLGL